MAKENDNTSLSQGDLEAKAQLLKLTLEKHNPAQLRDIAFNLMQEYDKGSNEHRCYAALYELMDILK